MMNAKQNKADIQRGEDLFQRGEIESALTIFESVLENDPKNVLALNNKGVALNKLGKPQEAEEVFYEVLRNDNRNQDAVFNLISNYRAMGRWEDAEKTLAMYGHCFPGIERGTIKQSIASARDQSQMMGANRNDELGHHFDYADIQERIQTVLSKKHFFIVGCPKSGTTWLQNIVNGHPEILCGGESNLNLLRRLLGQVRDIYNRDIFTINATYIGQDRNYALFNDQDLDYLFVSIMGLLFGNLSRRSLAGCLGMKNPDHLANMHASAHLLPQLKYIHIIRDGRDVTVSGWFHNLRTEESSFRNLYPDFFEYARSCARSWASKIQKARSFGNTYPSRYLELRYEDLHRKPDTIIQKILEFLGVDASRRMVDLCYKAGSFQRLSQGRERGQEDRKSFFRKGIVGDWKNHFDTRSLAAFQQHAGNLLQELGYV